jgi:hypothetical protein
MYESCSFGLTKAVQKRDGCVLFNMAACRAPQTMLQGVSAQGGDALPVSANWRVSKPRVRFFVEMVFVKSRLCCAAAHRKKRGSALPKNLIWQAHFGASCVRQQCISARGLQRL